MLPDRLVFRTSLACSLTVKNRCIIPTPPSLARVTAINDSVTVSIFALIMGMLSEILRVSLVERSVCNIEALLDAGAYL